jgi:hypothetical protein
VKDASQLDEPGSQTSQNLQDGKEQVARQTNLYLQDGKDDEVQYETDEEEFDDENLPSTGGPCHQYGGGAPHQQINTRARGQSSLHENDSQTILSLQDGKRNIIKLAARKPKPKPGYNLGYFTLWWSRMAREGVKDELARRRKEEDNASSARVRLLLGCGKTGNEPKMNKPLPSEISTRIKNTIKRQENVEVICVQPQVCPGLLLQSESFGPSEVRGDRRNSRGGTSSQCKRMKISHGGRRGEGVVSENYIHEQTQDLITDQTIVNTTTRRENIQIIDMAARGLSVVDSVPNGMGGVGGGGGGG